MIDKIITTIQTLVVFFAILFLGDVWGLENNSIYFSILFVFVALIRLDLSEIKSLVEKRNEH